MSDLKDAKENRALERLNRLSEALETAEDALLEISMEEDPEDRALKKAQKRVTRLTELKETLERRLYSSSTAKSSVSSHDSRSGNNDPTKRYPKTLAKWSKGKDVSNFFAEQRAKLLNWGTPREYWPGSLVESTTGQDTIWVHTHIIEANLEQG